MGAGDEDAEATETADSFLHDLANAPSRVVDPEHIGRFRIRGRLGAGGMGIVYRAEDSSLQREVAIKVLPPELQGDDERRKRLLREARAAAAVTHPNLAAVYEVGEADGQVFIAMELVEGRSLRDVLKDRVTSTTDIALQIARGLSRAHRARIIHRDLKPENVIVSDDGHVKILDFGLAKILAPDETVTHEGRVMGTPAYMAPEQKRGLEVTAAADVYAFGVMLHELLFGRRPEPNETIAHPLIRRCLAVDPKERPSDGDALVRELTAAAKTSRTWIFGALAAAAAIAIGVIGIRLKPSSAPLVSSAEAASPAPVTTRIIDLPIPPTSVPEAAAEYAAGLQMYRDDNWFIAEEHFDRAAKLDPSMAAAHLRSALMGWGPGGPPAIIHAHFEQAQAFRSHLTPRDQAFAEALEPLLMRSRQDKAEARRRLEAFYARYPADMEIISLLGWFIGVGEPARALGYNDLGIRLDPEDMTVLDNRAHALLRLDRPAEARATFEKAIHLSLTNFDAVSALCGLDAHEGKCAEFERHARMQAERRRFPGENLVAAYLANGKSDEAIAEVWKQFMAAEPALSRPRRDLSYRAALSLAHGNFVSARSFALEESKLIGESETLGHDLQVQSEVASFVVYAALESGDRAEALRAAREYDSRSEEWAGSFWSDSTGLHRTAVGEDAPKLAAFEAKQDAKANEQLESKTLNPLQIWYSLYGDAVFTPHDAERALAALPRFGPLNREANSDDAVAGHVYFVASRFDDALPYLQRSAVACTQFEESYARIRANWELGEVLSAKSDHEGACKAYGEILKWWGNAKPRSVTADKARTRMKALSCPAAASTHP